MNKAEFPAGVSQSVRCGPGLKAHLVYFSQYHFVSLIRVAEIFSERFCQPIREGMIVEACLATAEQVAPVNELVKQHLTEQEGLTQYDETGARVAGKLEWLHSTSTERLTCYQIHPKRGSQALDTIGTLPQRSGIALHDDHGSDFKYANVFHALCNAHHLRDLKFIHERYGQAWTRDLAELLVEIKQAVDQAKEQGQAQLLGAQKADFTYFRRSVGLQDQEGICRIDLTPFGRPTEIKSRVPHADLFAPHQ